MSFKVINTTLAGKEAHISTETVRFGADGVGEILSEDIYNSVLGLANFHKYVPTADELKAQEEAELLAKETAEKEEAERLAKEEGEKAAREEAERVAKEEEEKAAEAEKAKTEAPAKKATTTKK